MRHNIFGQSEPLTLPEKIIWAISIGFLIAFFLFLLAPLVSGLPPGWVVSLLGVDVLAATSLLIGALFYLSRNNKDGS